MRPVSDAFLRTISGSHQMVAEARVVAPGQTGVAPDGLLLAVESGDVQLDGTADVRSTVDLTVVGEGMWPSRPADPLAPYGNELHLRRGIKFSSGRTEWVSLGYHRIDSPKQDEVPNGPIRLTAQDRMAGLKDAQLVAARQYLTGSTVGSVLEHLVREVYPAAVIEWDDETPSTTLRRSLMVEQDRHAFLAELVTAHGKIWYWDHRGVLVIKGVSPSTSPVYTVSHGAGGVLVRLSRELSRDGVRNACVAVGEGADTVVPARAVVIDNDPASPTFFYGPFGQVPEFFSSPFIVDNGQARVAAAAILARSLGLPYSVDFSMVPNPALEPWDPVRITYPGRSETHRIERITVPLTAAGEMTATTREQTLINLRGL
ncbi:DUF5047 domain-containing protein [Micromonospora craterilacus]|uniref:DUF5047 domain-containing protein n=1 Tax=Micromonospora craterilacus TaxID=1655439 RepID=A0A2W2DR00_9ACTN|nr:DUF5047 domain-containing protein [Micromonospora craterilacus]PZG14416.1 DUF5047 domain-containing protein [Micromonospora craterilacus]